MKRRRKHALQFVLMLFSLFMLFVAVSIVYLEYKPMVVKAVTMEAGSPMVDAKEFLLEKEKDGRFITDINNLDLDIPGIYEIKIKIRNRIYTSNLEVVDTTAPTAATVNVMALKGEEVKPEAFVTDIMDATQVKVSFTAIPDTSYPGDQEVTVILEDTSHNKMERKSLLTVLDVKSSVQVEAGTMMDIAPSDFVDNDKYEVTFLTDPSGLDTSKPIRHEIQIDVDGRVLTSHIDVVDTTPPAATAVSRELWNDETAEAITFVKDIKDISGVKFSFKEIPDFTKSGVQEVTIIMEDTYGNKAELTSELTVKEDLESPVFSGVGNKTIYEGDAVSYKKGVSVWDNKDDDVQFQVDSSNVNTNKAGVYDVYYSAVDLSGNKVVVTANVTVLVLSVTDEMLNGLTDGILADIIKDGMTDREKAWEIFKWVKGNVGYTGDSDKSEWKNEAYRGIKNGVGDCFTFYAVSEALLTRAGIDNMRVTRVGGRTQHFWNLINCGDGWYHFDTCPHKDKLSSFMLTDAEVEEYTIQRGNNYYTFDKSLYPATPIK